MKKYDILDHTADITIKAYGHTLGEAFAHAGEAMFELMTDDSRIESKERVEVYISAIDIEGLLVKFLSELIVLYEVDKLILNELDVSFSEPNKLHAVGWGEKFSKEKHAYGMHIKAVSYHQIEVHDSEGKDKSYVKVTFDI